MTASILYDPANGLGTAGKARARREQVLGMSPSVVSETDELLVVRRWFADEVMVWRRVGVKKDNLFELVEIRAAG